MTEIPSLVPIYTLNVVDDAARSPRDAACSAARDGADAGEFLWAARDDRFECAIVLRPEENAGAAEQVLFVTAMALIEALGATVPPGIEADIVWPGRLRVNGGFAGGASLDAGPVEGDGPPAWLVAGAWLRIAAEDDREGGERAATTSLREEGCPDTTATSLAESFGRCFLSWMDRWQHNGFEPVRAAWMYWATVHGPDAVLTRGDELVAGRIAGLEDSGALVLETSAGMRTVPLTPADAAAAD